MRMPPLHSQYLILKWDFSCIDPFGTAGDIRRVLHDHVNSLGKARGTCMFTGSLNHKKFSHRGHKVPLF